MTTVVSVTTADRVITVVESVLIRNLCHLSLRRSVYSRVLLAGRDNPSCGVSDWGRRCHTPHTNCGPAESLTDRRARQSFLSIAPRVTRPCVANPPAHPRRTISRRSRRRPLACPTPSRLRRRGRRGGGCRRQR